MAWNPEGWEPPGWQPEGWQPETEEGSVYVETRKDFTAKPLRSDFYVRSNDVSDEHLFDELVKDAASTRKVRLKLYPLAVLEWKPNETVLQNEYMRPRIPNGFAYQATSTDGGTTAMREPRWPTTISDTVPDGSVTWTCRAASTNGINVVSGPSATSDPTGLTIADVAVAENCNILATYSGGVEGSSYDVVYTWTLDGVPMVGRQTVRIRRQ